MSSQGISWTNTTWNPIVGCSKVSSGCDHCWAERMARLHYHDEFSNGWDGHVKLFPERLNQPLHWRKPRKIAVGLMGDLWHPTVPNNYIAAVLGFAHTAKQHTFQFLTKRAGRLPEFFAWFQEWTMGAWPREYSHVQLGVSCECQEAADLRIPLLLQTPAAVRFVSCEPLLGPIKLTRHHAYCPSHDFDSGFCTGACPDRRYPDWIIVGGESGPGARPMFFDWASTLLDQCKAASIPFHLKQWGEYAPSNYNGMYHFPISGCSEGCFPFQAHSDKTRLLNGGSCGAVHVGKKAAGRLLDGREWLEFPEAKA